MVNDSFCPKCGKTNCEFISGFCKECFLQDHKVLELPKQMEIGHCRKCGKIRVTGKWLEQTDIHLKQFILSELKIKGINAPIVQLNFLPKEDGSTIAIVSVCGKIGCDTAEFETSSLIVPKEIVCFNCNLLDANYYEAVLQVRFSKKMKKEEFEKTLKEIDVLAEQLHQKDSLSRVTAVEKILNGFNAQVGSKRAAKKIVEYFERKHNAKITSSFTLAGVNASGKEKKRYTFLIRI